MHRVTIPVNANAHATTASSVIVDMCCHISRYYACCHVYWLFVSNRVRDYMTHIQMLQLSTSITNTRSCYDNITCMRTLLCYVFTIQPRKSWNLRTGITAASEQSMVHETTNAFCCKFNCGAFHLGVYSVFELYAPMNVCCPYNNHDAF